MPLALGALAIAALSGCVPSSSPTAAPSSSSSSASPSTGPSATPSASSTPAPTPTPVTIGCGTLISPDAMYAFNPNFGLLTSWTPTAGSAAATALQDSGIACRWSNQTSGDTIDVSVAHLDAASIATLESDAAGRGTPVTTYGEKAYFRAAGGIGTAEVFRGDYWLVASSVDFAEAGDPADLIDAALSALT